MTGLDVNWEAIGEILVLLFVISVVFETALTPIFNWRVFARHFEGKGVKTPITVLLALALLWGYDIDIFKHVIDAFAENGADPSSSTVVGRIITALLVAGGSGAIFNIFAKIGLRNPTQLAEKARTEREHAKKAKQTAQQARQQGGEGGGAPPASG